MKIVRFRARTVVAAAAVSLVCFIALIRTSYLLTGDETDENEAGHEKPLLENVKNDRKSGGHKHTDALVDNDKLLQNDDKVETTTLEIVDSVKDNEHKNDVRPIPIFDRRAFKHIDIEQKPAEARQTSGKLDLPSKVDLERHEAIVREVQKNFKPVNNNLNEQHKYPALPNNNNNNAGNNNNAYPDDQNNLKFGLKSEKMSIQSIIPVHLRPDQKGVAPKYPILTPDDKFIPSRRIVHLDLKGAAPKIDYFEQFFEFVSGLGATGILLEYEETFPYSGQLASIRASNSYSDAEVKKMLSWASKFNLEVIPLIQTFGHLEWILKHEKFAHYREVDRYAQVICLSNMDAVDLVKNAIDQVMQFHKDTSEFVHIGADEAFQIGLCTKCQQTIKTLDNSRDRLMARHIANISSYVTQTYGKRVLMWHDMLNSVDSQVLKDYKLPELVEPVIWAYAENLNDYLTPDTWFRFSSNFPFIWGASAFKGADGPSRFYSNVPHYLRNHISWTEQMNREYKHFTEFRGLILTGWQRFDHFAILCELLPVGIPSLVINLLTINYGKYDKEILKLASRAMQCSGNFEIDTAYGSVGGYCQFPGAKIYQLVQQFYSSQKNLQTQLYDDYQLRGWLSNFNIRHNYSSAWYLDQIGDKILMFKGEFNQLYSNLRLELSKVFHNDTVDEFLFEYVQPDVVKLNDLDQKAKAVAKMPFFPARPFPIKSDTEQKTKDNGKFQ